MKLAVHVSSRGRVVVAAITGSKMSFSKVRFQLARGSSFWRA